MAIFGLCGIGDEPVVDIPLDTLNQLTASDDFTLDMFKPVRNFIFIVYSSILRR